MSEGVTIAGYRLTGRTRNGELGTWHEAISPSGAPSGALRFDPSLISGPQAREGLIAAVSADRMLLAQGEDPPGLLPIADLVTGRGEIWLITAHPAMPTLAELLDGAGNGAGIDAGGATAILVEIARTLLILHAAGLTHGALHPGTVVIGDDGSPLLAERGLLATLRGAAQSEDVAAWAALTRYMAQRLAAQHPERGLAAGQAGGDTAAALLNRAADVALTQGLNAARGALLAPYDPGVPGSGGQAGPVRQDGDVLMRFGPGVPTEAVRTETTAAEIWRAGQTSTVHAGATDDRPARQRRQAGALAGTALLAMIITAVIVWLYMSTGSELVVWKVDVKLSKKTLGCDGRADFVGVVTTNGGSGTVRYEWLRSDGEKIEQEQKVRSGTTSLDLPLHWTVKGSGSFRGTATLRVLSPTADGEPLQSKASFSYKC